MNRSIVGFAKAIIAVGLGILVADTVLTRKQNHETDNQGGDTIDGEAVEINPEEPEEEIIPEGSPDQSGDTAT